jgi:two-component system LytT family response regulator
MTIRTVLADDEVLARLKLRELLRDEADVEIVGECSTASETIELVTAVDPTLLFLDIRMPDMDGFDVVGALNNRNVLALPHIIFTTACDQHAVRAFEINAVDYLLKPFTADRLRSALERVRVRSFAADEGMKSSSVPRPLVTPYSTRIVFKSRGRILFLPVSNIRWIAAEENYVRLSTEVETHLLRDTMANIERRLDPQMFLRVHRSFIVNLQYVKEVRTEEDGESNVVLVDGQTVAMSRGYRTRMNDWISR